MTLLDELERADREMRRDLTIALAYPYGFETADCARIGELWDDNGYAGIRDCENIILIRSNLAAITKALRAAMRFVPDQGTIQWEQREIELAKALAPFTEAVDAGEGV